MSYSGETLDVGATLQRLNRAARNHGFDCQALVEQAGVIVPVYTKSAMRSDSARVYISTGIHGDEPAGPLSVLDLLENGALSEEIQWTIFPMLNPAGFKLNQRENHEGVDLNRDYLSPKTKEVRAHLDFITASQPWDLALAVHEDWESEGFYLYDKPTELTQGWASIIIERVGALCPIDLGSTIDEMPAHGGIISPDFDTITEDPKLAGQWAEAIYLHLKSKIRGTFTFEAPSSYDLPTRILALNTAILTSVELLREKKNNE